MNQEKRHYLALLDRALLFAARHTDPAGRMTVDGEIDCKDSGWLVLGGAIRGLEAGWTIGEFDLADLCRRWTLASVRVDDTRSAWTTFALLYTLYLTGGNDGPFARSFSAAERAELDRFLLQIDMHYLYEASRNYRVAAAIIDALRLRFGYIEHPELPIEENIDAMLSGCLGNGFFNDDDCRGSRADRRIDAYSAEIIGLLLHFDEIFDFASCRHEEIMEICREFCRDGKFLIDADGEFAKWGRSLRGEAEAKKIFLWEFAEAHGLAAQPGDGVAAARAQLEFFARYGIDETGRIGCDKAFNRGMRDEYTTQVQAQGYGVYGLAMALKWCAPGPRPEPLPLPAEKESFVKYLPGPAIVCASGRRSGIHYILPLANRMTKNMFFWHNRITGENDVEVDVSAKFMPLPYFGRKIPAPYAGPQLPFLPMLRTAAGVLLVPRNLDETGPQAVEEPGAVRCRTEYAFCPVREYRPAVELAFSATLVCRPAELEWEFRFRGSWPEESSVELHLFEPLPECAIRVECELCGADARWSTKECAPSIYGPATLARVARVAPCDTLSLHVRYCHV